MTDCIGNRVTVDGVDLIALHNTLDAFRRDGDLARFRFRATNRWIDGGRSRSTC